MKGDNAVLIQRILSLRLEKAHLLGYANFAEAGGSLRQVLHRR